MIKYLTLLFLIYGISCQSQKSIIREHITIEVTTYVRENKTKASAMPHLKANSNLKKYERRFDFLLINIPEINQPEKFEKRNEIFNLYPNKSKIKRLYLEKHIQDKKLVACFEETIAPINHPNIEMTKLYTVDELMEVASKFFYCDKVNPDTSIQTHVCIGINGLRETKWEKDYTLLAAFCYEAIFNDFDKDISLISESYSGEKKKCCEQFRRNITTLEKYLEYVKLELFERIRNNATLKKELLAYYELNKANLAFRIIN